MVEMRKPIQVAEAVRLVMEHIHVMERKRFRLNIHMAEFLPNPLLPSMMCRLLTGHHMMDSQFVQQDTAGCIGGQPDCVHCDW